MVANNVTSHRRNGTFRSDRHPPVLLDVACCRVLKDGQLRWDIRYPLMGVAGLRCITLRLQVEIWFGTRGSEVQILSPRPMFFNHYNFASLWN